MVPELDVHDFVGGGWAQDGRVDEEPDFCWEPGEEEGI